MNLTVNVTVNTTNQSNDSIAGSAIPDPLAYAISLCVIMVASLIANSLVLAVVYKNVNGKMRTMSNFLIANVSVSDLLITLSNIPNSVDVALAGRVSAFRVGGTLGLILCGFVQFVWLVSFNVSFLSLVAIAVDRFLGVFMPFVSQRKPRLTILAIWLLSIAYPAPLIVTAGLQVRKNRLLCRIQRVLIFPNYSDYQKYITGYFTIFIVFPLIAISVLYSAIVVVLRRQHLPGNALSADRERRDKQNRKVLTMLMIVVLVFAVCAVPFWTAALVCVVADNSLCPSVLAFDILQVMAFSSCAFTPCVYFIFSENFRVGAKTVLNPVSNACCCCRNKMFSKPRPEDRETKSTKMSSEKGNEILALEDKSAKQ